MRALICDDARTDAYVCSQIASKFFTDVMVVGTPSELKVALREFKPDIVFMDVHIGQHNGIGLIEDIRSQADESSVLPMVVTTSADKEATRNLARAVGATEFMKKPVTEDHMDFVIKEVLVGYPGKPAQPGVIHHKLP